MQQAAQTEDITLKKKIQAFKTIYRSLHEWRYHHVDIHDFLVGKECLSLQEYEKVLEEYCQTKISKKDKIYSQVFQAWRMAKLHYNACREDNEKLFDDIYDCICKTLHSRYRLVRYFEPKNNESEKKEKVKKPGSFGKFSFFKKKEDEPEGLEMKEMVSVIKVEEVDAVQAIGGQPHMPRQVVEDKKLNDEIVWSIFYHLANPIPSGEYWPVERYKLGF